MKHTLLFAAALAALSLSAARAADAPFGDEERQAFAASMADIVASLRSSGLDGRFSVLAVKGDHDDVVSGLLKNAVTDSGKTYVEGREDPMWDAVIKEIAFDQNTVGPDGNILDPSTIPSIGSLQATDVLLYGAVRACSKTENRIFVELELHATEVKTKRHVWGGLFAKRWYVPGTDVPKGISELPLAVRDQLKRVTTSNLVASLKAQPKLSAIRSIALIPLAGDDDRYCTYIARDAITQTEGLVAKELDLASLQGARAVFRDIPVSAGDAVLYGAVRQLGWFDEPFRLFGLTLYEKFTVPTDFQAAIERNDTHDILWSDTVQSYEEWIEWNWPVLIALGVGVLVALIVFFSFLRAATRVR